MDQPRITQQTSTTLPLRSELTHDAPWPRGASDGAFRGPLQWALEGYGWGVVRRTTDFLLLCVAVVIALGGIAKALSPTPGQLPLLAMPLLVTALFQVRGIYRNRVTLGDSDRDRA